LANGNGSAFANDNLSNLFLSMDFARLGAGLAPFDNLQVLELFTRTSRDKSNYNAFVVTLRNNNWHGLLFDVNYTFSKSLDTVGAVQNAAEYYSSSYNPRVDYGPSFFNRPHVFNGLFNYELPFGANRRFSSSHWGVNRIIGGWYTAGIFRASSGIPNLVTVSGQTFGGGLDFGSPPECCRPCRSVPSVEAASTPVCAAQERFGRQWRELLHARNRHGTELFLQSCGGSCEVPSSADRFGHQRRAQQPAARS